MKRKYLNYIVFGYIAFLILGALYVDNILTHKRVQEYEEKKDNGIEVKPVDVYINLNNDTYKVKLTNQDTVTDALDSLRDDNIIFFERTLYTYGSDIEDVNHMSVPEGYHWRIFKDTQDITYQADKLKLVDDSIYTLKLIGK